MSFGSLAVDLDLCGQFCSHLETFLVKGLVKVFPFRWWVCWSVRKIKVRFQAGCVDHSLHVHIVTATVQFECLMLTM